MEPRLGAPVTSVLFAAKHVVVDGRWRRALGLAAFWYGLALLRRASPALAAGAHVATDLAAVALGHRLGEEQL